MTEYRTGTHHGVTIVAEGDGARCGRPDHDCARGHLVAVVVDGGEDFAERIAELLNAPTPDVPYTNGARESLAEVRRQLTAWDKLNPLLDARPAVATVMGMLRTAAAELGVDEDAPRGPLSATESAQEPSTEGSGGTEPAEVISERFWGEHRAHPTCIDVTTFSRPSCSEWRCGPECPREGA